MFLSSRGPGQSRPIRRRKASEAANCAAATRGGDPDVRHDRTGNVQPIRRTAMASTHRPSDNLLPAGRIWPLRRARGHRIVCVRGELWITVDGRLDDFFLVAGEAFAIETDARIVVYAVEDSAFRVVARELPTTRHRWWHALRNAFA
jgi:hypothetical protein